MRQQVVRLVWTSRTFPTSSTDEPTMGRVLGPTSQLAWGIRPSKRDPTRRALHERDVARSLLPNGIGDVSPCTPPKHQFETLNTILLLYLSSVCTLSDLSVGVFCKFSPPPVPLKIQQLDSQQQPTLGLDWAYSVPHSPQNIGAVAGDRSYES
ncbi:hypothetical protein PIB30_005194 [Stylosanthes scabra]|uniref:Uncharacterized protein n=1 Tax=Stylosanthes scabra TaxID=79078 RepID=A0ABU6S4B2_9FABA|nr:hypothetical protein [Stylosanthes scabra]